MSRAARKRALTGESSSRWAGAITRTTEDQVRRAGRNLRAERASLRARVRRVEARLAVPAGGKQGRVRGYATAAERHAKDIRLRGLKARLARAERQAECGAVAVTRGGRGLLRKRAHLADRPHGRYRLSCPVAFPYRGDEVAAQAATGAVRYDISYAPASGRWYLDASWKAVPGPVPALADLRRHPVVAVDVNAGHLAVAVVTADGNVTGTPFTVPLELAGLPATTRDGRLRCASITPRSPGTTRQRW